MKLMERAPQRVVAAVLSQPVGHRPEKPDFMYDAGKSGARSCSSGGATTRLRRVETYL